jgi:proton-translocating NAD(P)+ transhydrogenase subunit alpha
MILASILTTNLAILVLAGFVGFVVISKVPNTLHTPLMSGTNAIHGIVLLGGLLLLGLTGLDTLSKALLVIAVAFGTINIVGGFLVTDRMLEMFKSRPKPADAPKSGSTGAGSGPRGAGGGVQGAGGEPRSGGGGAQGAGGGAQGAGGGVRGAGGGAQGAGGGVQGAGGGVRGAGGGAQDAGGGAQDAGAAQPGGAEEGSAGADASGEDGQAS